MKVAIITASTAVYRGREEDGAGEVIREIAEAEGMDIVFMKPLPNDRKVLATVFERLADNHLADKRRRPNREPSGKSRGSERVPELYPSGNNPCSRGH